MNMRGIGIVVLAGLLVVGAAGSVSAGGECCMMGNLAAASSADGRWSLQFQYDYSYMKTLREGRDEVSPDEVLDAQIMSGQKKYSVPTEMIMQKYVLAAQARPLAKLQLLATVPYVVNDMEMRMAMGTTMGTGMGTGMGMAMGGDAGMGASTKSDMTMDTVQGLGDAIVGGMYTVYHGTAAGTSRNVALGLGLKMPTGENDVKKGDGIHFVHAMMQPGTGSWDPIFMVQTGYAAGKLGLNLNGTYHLTTTGDEGYEFGDMLGVDLIARYQILSALRFGLGLNYLSTAKDRDHDGKYTSLTSMIDNPENTGGTSVSLAPEILVRLPGTGGSLALTVQKPVMQRVNGTQQVMDWRVLASLGWAF